MKVLTARPEELESLGIDLDSFTETDNKRVLENKKTGAIIVMADEYFVYIG